jgi:pleckstrin homology domain containing family A member 8
MSFFSAAQCRFEDVPLAPGIATQPFLDACSAIVLFFDVLGSTAFAPVKSDINGNIKVRVSIQPVEKSRNALWI